MTGRPVPYVAGNRTPPLLRAPEPRVEFDYFPRHFGLGVGVRHHTTRVFALEIFVVLGPLSIALNLGRRMYR